MQNKSFFTSEHTLDPKGDFSTNTSALYTAYSQEIFDKVSQIGEGTYGNILVNQIFDHLASP